VLETEVLLCLGITLLSEEYLRLHPPAGLSDTLHK